MIPNEIKQSMYGFMMSHVLFAADELGIFEYLAQGRASTCTELGKLTGIEPSALERLLLAATSIKLLTRKDEYYSIPVHLKPFLHRNSSDYVGEAFSHFRDASTRNFLELKNGLVENKPQWKQFVAQGTHSSLFTEFYSDPKRLETFLSSMWGLGYVAAKQLVRQYPLHKYHQLIDVGGGSGSFAIAALEAYPSLRAIVFDLPAVRPYLENKAIEHMVLDRLHFVAGDFFQDKLPEGDVYVLGYILSDWNRQDGTTLLKKIYNSLPKEGSLLISEKLFNENKDGPIETAMMNLAMLLETWGQHYSGSEYIEWLQEIGYKNCQLINSNEEKHIIVGVK